MPSLRIPLVAHPPTLVRPTRAASERFVGTVTLGLLAVAASVIAIETVAPGEHADAVWLAIVAVVLFVAREVGFWPSLLVAFVAAVAVDVFVIHPAGRLGVGSVRDLVALVLFLAISILGGATVARSEPSRPLAPHGAAGGEGLIEPLTDRELEILGLLASGMSNREIADEFVVSGNTVKSHLEHLYGKLGVSSRLRAIARARALGLLDDPRIRPKG
ncbi:MAG TPA: LuxR C-terminal-related transcriptional regulator [Candidatus Limnocylindrales bacterium]|nr:LuxR C-terminal-related transcriptional regulator [Candidatus Limnocylindrales bacterium]